MEYLLIALFILCLIVAYYKGCADGEAKESKISHNVYSWYDKYIQSLKDEIEEIKNRPENWKNKIAEAKETFKDA